MGRQQGKEKQKEIDGEINQYFSAAWLSVGRAAE